MEATAERMAAIVDELLGKQWNRSAGAFVELPTTSQEIPGEPETVATCACGSGIPVQTAQIDGQEITLIALPLIFKQFRKAGKPPLDSTMREMLETVKIYNQVRAGMDEQYLAMLIQEYTVFCEKEPTP